MKKWLLLFSVLDLDLAPSFCDSLFGESDEAFAENFPEEEVSSVKDPRLQYSLAESFGDANRLTCAGSSPGQSPSKRVHGLLEAWLLGPSCAKRFS